MTRALTRRRALAWTATAAAFAAAPAHVRAAADLRIVVPYPAGGSPDNSARIASAEAARELGVSVVVENRPGASGLLGARAVSRGRPTAQPWSTSAPGTSPWLPSTPASTSSRNCARCCA